MRRLITTLQLGMAASLSATRTALLDKLKATPAGASISQEFALRAEGKGSPHRASLKRVFDDQKPTRVTFYRDSAAWCPYCQKLWMLLEEKQINYDVDDDHGRRRAGGWDHAARRGRGLAGAGSFRSSKSPAAHAR